MADDRPPTRPNDDVSPFYERDESYDDESYDEENVIVEDMIRTADDDDEQIVVTPASSSVVPPAAAAAAAAPTPASCASVLNRKRMDLPGAVHVGRAGGVRHGGPTSSSSYRTGCMTTASTRSCGEGRHGAGSRQETTMTPVLEAHLVEGELQWRNSFPGAAAAAQAEVILPVSAEEAEDTARSSTPYKWITTCWVSLFLCFLLLVAAVVTMAVVVIAIQQNPGGESSTSGLDRGQQPLAGTYNPTRSPNSPTSDDPTTTISPMFSPTSIPTALPTWSPTDSPTASPTSSPTANPTTTLPSTSSPTSSSPTPGPSHQPQEPAPAPRPPPQPTSPSTPVGGAKLKCFRPQNSTFQSMCYHEDYPAQDHILLIGCDSPGMMSAAQIRTNDCICYIYRGEIRDDFDKEMTCDKCTFCGDGSSRVGYDCSNVEPNSSCPGKDCSGQCIAGHQPQPAPAPAPPSQSQIQCFRPENDTVSKTICVQDDNPEEGHFLGVGCHSPGITATTIDIEDCWCVVFVGEMSDDDWETCGSCSLCANGSTRVSYDCSDVHPNSHCPRKRCDGVCSTRRAVVHDHGDEDDGTTSSNKASVLENNLINHLAIMMDTEATSMAKAQERLVETYAFEIGGGRRPKK